MMIFSIHKSTHFYVFFFARLLLFRCFFDNEKKPSPDWSELINNLITEQVIERT